MMITSKMWPLEHQQGFPLIWPGEVVFDIKWPSFKLDLEIIKTNILSNIYDDFLKNVTSGAYMPSLTPWGKTSLNSDVSHGLTPWAVKLTESKNPIEKKS